MDPVERNELRGLVLRAQAGEPAAVAALVERYWKKIYVFCYRYLQSQASAEDLAQATFLKVVEQIRTLKDPMSFTSWLYQIARNLCHDAGRRQKRQAPLTEEAEAILTDCEASPEENVQTKMQRERVAQAISRLSADHQDVVLLVHYQGLSYKEAADILGTSIPVVKTRLFRALQKLREQRDSLRG